MHLCSGIGMSDYNYISLHCFSIGMSSVAYILINCTSTEEQGYAHWTAGISYIEVYLLKSPMGKEMCGHYWLP